MRSGGEQASGRRGDGDGDGPYGLGAISCAQGARARAQGDGRWRGRGLVGKNMWGWACPTCGAEYAVRDHHLEHGGHKGPRVQQARHRPVAVPRRKLLLDRCVDRHEGEGLDWSLENRRVRISVIGVVEIAHVDVAKLMVAAMVGRPPDRPSLIGEAAHPVDFCCCLCLRPW